MNNKKSTGEYSGSTSAITLYRTTSVTKSYEAETGLKRIVSYWDKYSIDKQPFEKQVKDEKVMRELANKFMFPLYRKGKFVTSNLDILDNSVCLKSHTEDGSYYVRETKITAVNPVDYPREALIIADEFQEDDMFKEERLMIKSSYPDEIGCFSKRFPDIIKVQSVNETGELNQDIPTLIVGYDATKKLLGDELVTTILTRERNEKLLAVRENVFICPGLNDNLKESRKGVYQFIDKVQRDVLLGNLVKAINKLLENGYDDDLIHILDRKLRDTRYKTEMEYMFK